MEISVEQVTGHTPFCTERKMCDAHTAKSASLSRLDAADSVQIRNNAKVSSEKSNIGFNGTVINKCK